MKIPISHPILCGSIAGSIGGMGVKMHNAAFKDQNLPYVYVSFEPVNAQKAIDAMRGMGIRGLGVTMPFKEEVIPLIDKLDSVSREIGAVNTIVNDEGILTGYNTDVYGFITALQESVDCTNKSVVVLGAGGVAKTIIWSLKKYTSKIQIYARDVTRGRQVASTFDVEYKGDMSELTGNEDYDILVNATSVGFKTSESILKEEQIRPNTIVFDVVFIPTSTTLLTYAQNRGCFTISGTRMLMHQACKQFELYTKNTAPVQVYEQVMNSILKSYQS